MEKTLRYLLIAVILSTASLLSVANAKAQSLAQLPDNEMRSTSVLPTSGSTLPQAAVDGPTTTYDEGYKHHGQIRRAADGDDDDTPPSDPHGPMEDPIGDAALPLALLACAYLIIRVVRKRV